MPQSFFMNAIFALAAMLALPTQALANEQGPQFLEVADLSQIMTLPQEAREEYIGYMREMLVELAEADRGTDLEFFGGSIANKQIPGWKAGHYVILNAFMQPAVAQDVLSGDISGVPPSSEGKVEVAAPPPAATCPNGAEMRNGLCDLGAKNTEECHTTKGGVHVYQPAKLIGITRKGFYCLPIEKYVEGMKNPASKSWYAKDAKFAEAAMKKYEDEKARLGKLAIRDPKQHGKPSAMVADEGRRKQAIAKNLCATPDMKCDPKPKKGSKEHREYMEKYSKGRNNLCLFAGNVSRYRPKEGTSNPDIRAGNCEPVRSATFGGLTVSCEKKSGKRMVLCNPMLFDVESMSGDGKSAVGRCVEQTANATRDCNNAFNTANKDAKPEQKRFWDTELPGVQEKMRELTAALNMTCKDERVSKVQCAECKTMQGYLAQMNKRFKECKPETASAPAGGANPSSGGQQQRPVTR